MARTLRTENKLDPKQPLNATLYSRNDALETARRHAAAIQKLANVKMAFKDEAAPKAAAVRSTAKFDLVLEVPAAQQEAQQKRIEKEIEQLDKNIASMERQLSDETFLAKAPPQVIEGMRKKLEEYRQQRRKYE